MAKITEKDLERYLVRQCKKHGVLCYKFSSPARRGVPDRVLIHNGTVLFLELKAPGKKPTQLQRHHLNLIDDEDVPAVWTDCKEGVDQALQIVGIKGLTPAS
ncbi:MAG: hypothetical protein QNI96_05170 [Woeseiaceae bacterium]|nr:hypothetical protein [Woeseiaceae bacterium]